MLYGQNEKDINASISKMFLQKYSSTSNVIDLAVLPPCRYVLYLHAQRANYVAKIWKSSNLAWHGMPNIKNNGWLENGEIDWVENVFPDVTEDILVDPEFDVNYNDSYVMIFPMRNVNVKNNLIIVLQIYLFSSYYYILSSH